MLCTFIGALICTQAVSGRVRDRDNWMRERIGLTFVVVACKKEEAVRNVED